ncbi:MAG: peptidylprolyl isomerase [Akkermansiaceae bacterium]|nr:peptidylprolyl isomerase [Akkermansia sp.]MCD7798782.1 peptidylprolyl isomerase [Akkermansiaceae bacterium]
MTTRNHIACALLPILSSLSPQGAAQDEAHQGGGASQQPAPKVERVVNRIAASVNGRPITSSAVRARLIPIYRELQALYPRQGPKFNSELVKAKKNILNDLIETEMVLGEFEEKGYVIPNEHIEAAINNRILVQFNGNRELFLQWLQQSGLSLAEFRDQVKREETVAGMRASLYSDRGVPPTPDEIAAEYQLIKKDFRDITKDTITFDKIFISIQPEGMNETPEDRLTLAEHVAKEIRDGKISFADAAKRYSQDSRAEEGGRWPATKRGDLAPEFAAIAFSADPGKLIGPIYDYPYGFTILRVIGKSLAPAPPLSEIKQQVDASVRRKRSEARYRQWIERLRKKAIIRTFI